MDSSPTGKLQHRSASHNCENTGDTLLRWGTCKAVRYCTREHQEVHRPAHKKICQVFK